MDQTCRAGIHFFTGVQVSFRAVHAKAVAVTDAKVASISLEPDTNLLALDEALNALAEIDPQQSRIIELRYFGGLTIEETAEVMELSPATIKREWAMARAWLHQSLTGAESRSDSPV